MAYMIEFEAGVARLVDHTVLYEIPSDQLADNLTISRPFISPRLPAGVNLSTVFTYFDDQTKTVQIVVERAPRTEQITIALKHDPEDEDAEDFPQDTVTWHGYDFPDELNGSYDLPVPWEYYAFHGTLTPNPTEPGKKIFVMRTSHLYWAKQKVQRFGEALYVPRLPNLLNGSICWGDTNQGTNGELGAKIASMVLGFYSTPFNEDYGHLDMPVPLSQLPDIQVDALGIPDYPWNNFNSALLTVNASADAENMIHTDLAIPVAQGDTTEALPPETWNLDAVRNWYASLTPARRMYINTLQEQHLEQVAA